MSDSFPHRLDRYRMQIDLALLEIGKDAKPIYLYNPIHYVLSGKGKRLRPVMVFVTASGFGVAEEHAFPAAMAVEILHNFSLVHDDIMDGDDLRHGKETVHRRWDNSTAILAGDGILALAYDQLNSINFSLTECFKVFTDATLRLCEGQALDKDFELRQEVSVQDYLKMVSLKTGTLLSLSCQLGAIIGGANGNSIVSLAQFGQDLGQAFQIQDDILEIYSDFGKMGKSLGSDIVTNKKTFLTCKAIEMNSSKWYSFKKSLVGNSVNENLMKIRDYFDTNGMSREAQILSHKLFESALSFLEEMPTELQTDLTEFVELLIERKN